MQYTVIITVNRSRQEKIGADFSPMSTSCLATGEHWDGEKDLDAAIKANTHSAGVRVQSQVFACVAANVPVCIRSMLPKPLTKMVFFPANAPPPLAVVATRRNL